MDDDASHQSEVEIAPLLVIESDDTDPFSRPSVAWQRIDAWKLEGCYWTAIGPQCHGPLCRGGPSLGFGKFNHDTERCEFCERYSMAAEWRNVMTKICGNCLKTKDTTEFDPMEKFCRSCTKTLAEAKAVEDRRASKEAIEASKPTGSRVLMPEADPELAGAAAPGKRVCTKCGVPKDASEFYPGKGNCKACLANYAREYARKKNGGKTRQPPVPAAPPPAGAVTRPAPAVVQQQRVNATGIEEDDFTWAVRFVKFGPQPGDELRARRVLAKLLIADLQEIAGGE